MAPAAIVCFPADYTCLAGKPDTPHALRRETPYPLGLVRPVQRVLHTCTACLADNPAPYMGICECRRAAVALVRALVVNRTFVRAHGIAITVIAVLVGGALYALYRIALACCERIGAGSAPPGMDARDVPEGATVEVRRVLLATTHYDVLQVWRKPSFVTLHPMPCVLKVPAGATGAARRVLLAAMHCDALEVRPKP